MTALRQFFELNQIVVLFVYGQVFFVLGAAIAWQSRTRSRLSLARSLGWLGAFGLVHAIHEWGDIFIPIQAGYLSEAWIEVLLMAQAILLALSFAFLFQFGTSLLASVNPHLRWLQALPSVLLVAWMTAFLWASQVTRTEPAQLVIYANVWARYLLGFLGALAAGAGLWWQNHRRIELGGRPETTRIFAVASASLAVYAVLAGLLGPEAPFFPAHALNAESVLEVTGVPVQVMRSLVGFVLLVSIVRGLLIVNRELDQRMAEMEDAEILASERLRISRELHDGAIQTVYTAGLLAESIRKRMVDDDPLAGRLDRVVVTLQHAIHDMRHYITQLEPSNQGANLLEELQAMAADPYLHSLAEVDMAVHCDDWDSFSPARATHVLAIVNEALSNVARHARARHVWLALDRVDGQLTMTVADDGTGFAQEGVESGFGLRNMRDRARLLGGTIRVEPRSPRGTVVSLQIPWEDGA